MRAARGPWVCLERKKNKIERVWEGGTEMNNRAVEQYLGSDLDTVAFVGSALYLRQDQRVPVICRVMKHGVAHTFPHTLTVAPAT